MIEERAVIHVADLSYTYAGLEKPALRNLGFTIHAGEHTALLGANGSGKSTLLSCLNGLIKPPAGAVFVYGMDPAGEGALPEIRRRLGTVMQNPDDQIVSSVVEEDIAFGPENLGLDPGMVRSRVEESLELCNLKELRGRSPQFLSGGERQRLALAGTLAMDTETLVFDEAVSMLDPPGREHFLSLVEELNRRGKTILQVTHSLEEAFRCRRCLVLHRGALVFDGKPRELLEQKELENWGFVLPESVKTLRLLGKLPGGFRIETLDPGMTAEAIRRSGLAAGKGPEGAPVFPAEPASSGGPGEAALSGGGGGAVLSGGNVPAADSRGTLSPAGPGTIRFEDASYRYPGGTSFAAQGMDRVSFELTPPPGQGLVLALVGRSGSGKSTVLKHINALLLPSEGRVLVAGQDTLDRRVPLASLRLKAALAVQSPEAALFARFVADDAAFGPANAGLKGAALTKRVRTAMERAGLPFEEFADRETRSLSGGEKRRAAIAGIAAMESDILLLDEPLAALDGFHQGKILNLIGEFRRAGKTVVISTHSMETAALADMVGIMAGGTLAALGTPRKIFGERWDPRWGLELPWTAEVARRLGKPGAAVPEPPLTAEELAALVTGSAGGPGEKRESGENPGGSPQSARNSGGIPPSAENPGGIPGKPPDREGARQRTPEDPGGLPRFPHGTQKNPPVQGAAGRRRRKTGIEFFRNVTLGQFLDRPPALRNPGSGIKLLLFLAAFAAALTGPPPFFPLGILILTLAAGWLKGRVGPRYLLRGLIPIAPGLLIIMVLQLLYPLPGDASPVILRVYRTAITAEKLIRTGSLIIRLASMMALVSLYSALTPLRETLEALRAFLSRFAPWGLPAQDISLAAGIALRFVPVLTEEAERIVTAQLSRGRKKISWGMILSIILPLLLRTMERSEGLTKAILLRLYGYKPRAP
ncbi:MAG: ATP-binding cassette domain-containing protein [Spirochaetaceae bacterium]|jgi:energy-coupling factor transport system ATP-binding protein|nr:ATP-binding cassette domain-containing protein [Spirochaetaceae bacterium]